MLRRREVSVATGRLAAPYIQMLCDEFMEKFPKITIHVYPIRNDYFGEQITVSGLITGQDLIAQLQDQPLGSRLLIPQNMVRMEEQDFLDDVTLAQVSLALQVQVDIVKSSGQDFVKLLLE